jgi:hypothetical protein
VWIAEPDFSPLDEALGLGRGSWSEGVVKQAVWVAGKESYREAAETLRRLGGINMSSRSVWRCTQQWGQRLCDWQQAEVTRSNAVPSRDEPQRGETKHDMPMGVSIDGWMVHIRGEGWKEVKSGVCYEVMMVAGSDEVTGETMEIAQAEACSYVAHLGGAEEFGQKLWHEAMERRVPAAYEKACVSDAAHWIWNLCLDYFPQAEQIVDWYHAVEHLYKAAHLLHGEHTDQARRWATMLKTDLYQGHAARIARDLEQATHQFSGDRAEALRSEATFFRNHQRRMRYLEYRENGWPIGSGSIESGCKQFQARLKGAGMRWSRPGAKRMLALRASIISGYFDYHWNTLANSPPI